MSPGVADKTFLGRIVWSVVVNLIVFLGSAAAGDDICMTQAASNKAALQAAKARASAREKRRYR
jgi:hypothetical protein